MSSSRKLQKVMMRNAGQRKSPRISAMEAWQARWSSPVAGLAGDGPPPSHSHPQQLQHSISTNTTSTTTSTFIRKGNDQGPAFQTRSRKKRKLKPVEQVAASTASLSAISTSPKLKQWGKQLNPEVIHTGSGQYASFSPTTWLPEKRVLELLLDILQRRDTYDIFGEPVDQNQVEDYYDIIEEPMDFGTMRAKLHEDMYRSLEEFEHDVFLIFNNAMHFNSSGTIYFRQACAINELAKKVFHILKTDPQNFESHFYEKRRSAKRVQGGSKASVVKSTVHEDGGPSKTLSCSLQRPRSSKILHGDFESDMHVAARDPEVISGKAEAGRRYRPIEGDRCWTYRPWRSPNENDSICSISSNSNILEHVNHSYKESLMAFVKDLGQTAQIVAKRKLSGFQIPSLPKSDNWKTNTLTSVTASESKTFSTQLTPHLISSRRCGDQLVSGITGMGENETPKATLTNDQTSVHKSVKGEIWGSDDISIPSTSGFNQVHQKRCSWLNSYEFGVPVRELNFSVSRFIGTGNKPEELKHSFLQSRITGMGETETPKATLNNDQTNVHKSLKGEIWGSDDISIPSTSGFNQVHQNRCSWLNSHKFGVPVRELNFSVPGFIGNGNKPEDLKHPFLQSVRASNLSKLKWEDNDQSPSRTQ